MLRLIANIALIFIAFLLGAWYGGHDRTCVTATAENGATVVYCSTGDPSANQNT